MNICARCGHSEDEHYAHVDADGEDETPFCIGGESDCACEHFELKENA